MRALLKRLAQESWVASPYGLDQSGDEEEQGEEAASFDERGCHTIYSAGCEPSSAKVAALAKELAATRQTARTAKQIPRLDAYGLAPSLWLGPFPLKQISEGSSDRNGNVLRFIHEHLWKLTWPATDGHRGDDGHGVDDDGFDFYSRALVFQALRRALLRESVLLRLLPERSDLDQSSWGELLSQAFFNDLPHQHESMADRVGVFLEDLHAASGSVRNPESARGAFYGATRLRDPKACGKEIGVTLVPLPSQMVKDLRVHLDVWTDATNE